MSDQPPDQPSDQRQIDDDAAPTGQAEAHRGESESPGGAEQRPLSPWQVIASTAAAAIGVQSSRNRQRDFRQGRASHFIIAGVLFTVLFVVVMVVVVNLVLGAAN